MIEQKAAELTKNYQQQIQQQKNSIIDELRSSEKILINSIKQNPKIWNNKCLVVKLNEKKLDKNFGLHASITVNHPNVPSDALNKSEAISGPIDISELDWRIRLPREKEPEESDRNIEDMIQIMDEHTQEQREKRRQRELNTLRQSWGLSPVSLSPIPPPAPPTRNDCQTQ